MVKKAATTKKAAKINKALEPVDILGNWKVEDLTFEEPVVPFGLTTGKSTFKIVSRGSKHVLIKKKSVRWSGSKKEIPLTEIASSDKPLFNANLRLKAVVTFEGDEYEVSFGSDDNGVSLKIQAIGDDLQNNPGGTGTSARGGG